MSSPVAVFESFEQRSTVAVTVAVSGMCGLLKPEPSLTCGTSTRSTPDRSLSATRTGGDTLTIPVVFRSALRNLG